MSQRFVDSRTISVRPGDSTPVDIGPAELATDDDTFWIKVTSSSSGDCPWPWSYGLLTWITDNGRELGTVKINGVCEGEVFRLGNGLSPSLRTGSFSFTPRSYNLKWIELGNPWTLTFSWVSGSFNSGSVPVLGTRATLGVLADLANSGVSYAIKDGVARILLTP